jgi:transposase
MSTSSLSILYVGMDVHKDSVMLAVLPADAREPALVERLPNDPKRLQRFFARLAKGGEVRACYEASGVGYVLHRALTAWGLACEIVAPSLIPTRPGVQRKHDRRDAIQLARLHRAGELVTIRIPTEAEERVRDLVRCREAFQKEILQSRHYILKFLARRGLVYREGTAWKAGHFAWLRQLGASGALVGEDAVVFGEYLALLEYKLGRREALDRQIEALALTPAYRSAVARLRCLRGVDTHAAMVLACEIGDWSRFTTPRELMAYLGLVPRERSSGDQERRGGITKAGNSRCRHVLIQAAWAYRHPPALSAGLKLRQRGQPASVVAHAWKAQHRLHTLYRRLAYKRRPQVAVVAVARELVGFLWAVMRLAVPADSAPRTQAA